MDLLTIVRLLVAVAWGSVLFSTARPLYRLIRGRSVGLDPLFAIVALMAVLILAFQGHWLLAPGKMQSVVILNFFSLALGFMARWVVRKYKVNFDGGA